MKPNKIPGSTPKKPAPKSPTKGAKPRRTGKAGMPKGHGSPPKRPVSALSSLHTPMPLMELLPEGLDLRKRVRTRTEIRAACAQTFDNLVKTVLDEAVERVAHNMAVERAKHARGEEFIPMIDLKTIGMVQGVAQLYAQLGIGYVGVNQIDPADIPNLPAPVFQSIDPNAPLPDGKPE